MNPARELPPEAEFDFGGFQRLLHRLARFGRRVKRLFGLTGGLSAFLGREALRDATPTKAMTPPSAAKGANGRPGIRASTSMSSAASRSARGWLPSWPMTAFS